MPDYDYKVVLNNVGGINLPCELSGITSFDHYGFSGNCLLLTGYTDIIYTVCATYHPYLNDTGKSFCLLSCGPLTSSTVSIGDYLIEWRWVSYTGSIEFISGNLGNSDSTIEAFHPFTDMPLPAGILFPVIKYIYINGYKYVSTEAYVPGERYSADLLECLSPIIIENMTCSNGTYEVPNYSHDIEYEWGGSLSNTGQSSRSVTFLLNSGGTTKYFAWAFKGDYVPDTMKITYSGSTTQELAYWTVGQYTSTNYITSPKTYQTLGKLSSVANLSGISYVDGDYLVIDITPNANINTKWELDMKCLTGNTPEQAIDCESFPYGYNIIDPSSITMIVNSGTGITYCSYDVFLNVASGSSITNYDIGKYFTINNIREPNGASIHPTYTQVILSLRNFTNYAYMGIQPNGWVTCNNMNSGSSMIQSGDILTLVFQDSVDYSIYKNSYNYITGHSYFTSYTPDNTDVNHYKRITLKLMNNSVQCGDVFTGATCNFHYSSPVYFDDTGKTITIIMSGTTNGITEELCNNLYSLANVFISNDVYVNGIIGNVNFPFTKIGYVTPFTGLAINPAPTIYNETGKTFFYYNYVHPAIINNVCDMPGWILWTGGTVGNSPQPVGYYVKYKVNYE